MNQEVKKDTPRTSLDQLVTFRVAQEELAVPIHLVQEIIRVPDIIRVPAAPEYVDGIGNLRGQILPVVNLRSRLGLEPIPVDEQTRVVVLRSADCTTGIVVDGVSEVITIEEKILEAPPPSVAGIEGQYLRSIAKVDGKRMVMILDETKMLPDLNWSAQGNTMETQNIERAVNGKAHSDLEQYVTFNVVEEEFAINIMQVKEIIKTTEITPVPKAPRYIVGVMSLRNHLLPIMDLRLRFNMKTAEMDQAALDSRRIVVVDLNGILMGIQVDSVSQVLTMDKAGIEAPPAIVRSAEADCLQGVGKLDGGKRIIMLLEVAKLVPSTDHKSLEDAYTQAKNSSEASQKGAAVADEAQLVCFHVADEEYALDIMKVQEIIRLREITSVPHTRAYMEGIINLRGTVVPVVDMRKRFSMEQAERTENNRIVVVNIQGKINGLVVDAVSEVIRMPKSQIESAPSTVSDANDRYIDGVGKLNEGKRIILLIKADNLLNEEKSPAA